MTAPSVSFLIPAHNEEKVIGHALEGLAPIVGPDVEVLVGLDGCTDGTRAVVERCPFAKWIELDERGGKQAVLRMLLEKAQGEVIVVHDADWRFVCDRQGLDYLVNCFSDPALGGIVLPPHNIPFWGLRTGIGSRGFIGAGLGVLLLWEYLLSTQVTRTGTSIYVNPDRVVYPFTVNIFRRGIIPPATTAADDFERFIYLVDAGYQVLILNDRRLPYFQITDQWLSFRDHFRQRVKNHIARTQLASTVRFGGGLSNFYLPFTWYCLRNASRLGWRDSFLVLTWYVIILLAFLRARFILRTGTPDATQAWRYRLARHVPEQFDGVQEGRV